MRYSKNRVSIIIPAKNEALGLKKLLPRLIPYSTDIIVVDGHSTDSTKDVVATSNARYFLEDEEGIGSALKLGIKKAKNDFLLFMDADGSHDTKDIPLLLNPLFKNESDAVIGSRRTGGTLESTLTFWKIIKSMGTDFTTYLVNKKFNTKYSDILFGFRSIKKTVAKDLKLKSDSFEIEEEIVIKMLKNNYKLLEVPIKEHKRVLGETKSHYSDIIGYTYCLIKELYF